MVGDKQIMQPAAQARSAARSILDFVLPPRCPGCGAIIATLHSFCLDCWSALDFLADPCCSRCGLPFPFAQGEGAQCGACLADPPDYDRLRAAVVYGPISRKVALKLKYSRRPGVAETLAHFMVRQLRDFPSDALLVPVPLHRWRIWSRGYNQAALIASALARRTGSRADLGVLLRTKRTPSLRGLGRRERALVVRGAFAVARAKATMVAGRNVILVDDIYTSGATANACSRTLRRAGAASVNIICWARVVAEESAIT